MFSGLKYCGDMGCQKTAVFDDHDTVCSRCGQTLTPCIECLCGQYEINPKERKAGCPKCLREFTEAYLGRCMAKQFGWIVREVVDTLGKN